MRGPRFANYRESYDGTWVRVMCPDCGAGGAQRVDSYQPLCHKCNYKVYMLPASNNKAECTWDEMKTYLLERKKNDKR